ncbi:hypothetical protein EGW08_009033 [Elysia chlorotica]|uniref:Uncharacterized protein n=1 Tax=Elysia chlorotica TaxID=188477 RepID=A0A3S0ZUL9_ELYCH|nr:hypothetical protein EGW08_009033 [Elysia chlorotica]
MATRKRRLRKRKRLVLKSDLSRPSSSSSGSLLPKVNRLNSASSDGGFSQTVTTQTGRKKTLDAESCEPETHPYHAHLHSSLRAFRFRKWRPLNPDQVPQSAVTRCRPLSCRPTSSQALRSADVSNLLTPPLQPAHHRPCSASQLLMQKRPDTPRVDYGPFDMLSPRVLAHLVTDPRPLTPLSTYGDVIEERRYKKRGKKAKSNGGPSDEAAEGKTRDAQTDADGTRFFDNDGEVSVTSGIESDGLDSDDDKDSSDNSDDDDDNDSISELEKGKEPPVDKNRRAPDLHLRPERLDQLYIPENKRDHARRFDFDASKCEIPAYEFECPVEAPYNKINFRFHACEGSDWRHTNYAIGAEIPSNLTAMFDRLLEMEKRQIETEEWEEKRMKQLAAAAAVAAARRRAASRRLASGKPVWRGAGVSNGLSSGSSGVGGLDNSSNGCNSSSSKRCCHSCLQQACVGDCPDKRVPATSRLAAACARCHQPLCTGTCTELRYDQRMRRPRSDEDDSAHLPHSRFTGHRNCKTCQQRHNAKFINANNLVLGRPKSAFSTYSRGKGSAKPRDLRPKSAFELSDGLSKGMERLGIDPLQPTPPAGEKPPRAHSRAGLLPGKSYNSNLSRSLADISSKRKRSAKAKKRVSAL